MSKIEITDAFDEDADWLIPARVLVPTGDFDIPTLTEEVDCDSTNCSKQMPESGEGMHYDNKGEYGNADKSGVSSGEDNQAPKG